MKKKILLLWCCMFLFLNCKKKEINLQLLDCIIINSSSYSTVTGMESYNETFAENDSIFYYNHKMYKNGKLYHLDNSLQNEKILSQYKLKIIKNSDFFKYNVNNYKDHFYYEDIVLNKKIICDSGYVNTLKTKQNEIYQFIDIRNKPILLQVSCKGKIYKFNIEKKYPEEKENLGSGISNAFLYDIDKDGKEEFVIVFSNSIDYILYVQVYKMKES